MISKKLGSSHIEYYIGIHQFFHIEMQLLKPLSHMKVSPIIGLHAVIIHFERWDFPWNQPSSELGVPPWRAGTPHMPEYCFDEYLHGAMKGMGCPCWLYRGKQHPWSRPAIILGQFLRVPGFWLEGFLVVFVLNVFLFICCFHMSCCKVHVAHFSRCGSWKRASGFSNHFRWQNAVEKCKNRYSKSNSQRWCS